MVADALRTRRTGLEHLDRRAARALRLPGADAPCPARGDRAGAGRRARDARGAALARTPGRSRDAAVGAAGAGPRDRRARRRARWSTPLLAWLRLYRADSSFADQPEALLEAARGVLVHGGSEAPALLASLAQDGRAQSRARRGHRAACSRPRDRRACRRARRPRSSPAKRRAAARQLAQEASTRVFAEHIDDLRACAIDETRPQPAARAGAHRVHRRERRRDARAQLRAEHAGARGLPVPQGRGLSLSAFPQRSPGRRVRLRAAPRASSRKRPRRTARAPFWDFYAAKADAAQTAAPEGEPWWRSHQWLAPPMTRAQRAGSRGYERRVKPAAQHRAARAPAAAAPATAAAEPARRCARERTAAPMPLHRRARARRVVGAAAPAAAGSGEAEWWVQRTRSQRDGRSSRRPHLDRSQRALGFDQRAHDLARRALRNADGALGPSASGCTRGASRRSARRAPRIGAWRQVEQCMGAIASARATGRACAQAARTTSRASTGARSAQISASTASEAQRAQRAGRRAAQDRRSVAPRASSATSTPRPATARRAHERAAGRIQLQRLRAGMQPARAPPANPACMRASPAQHQVDGRHRFVEARNVVRGRAGLEAVLDALAREQHAPRARATAGATRPRPRDGSPAALDQPQPDRSARGIADRDRALVRRHVELAVGEQRVAQGALRAAHADSMRATRRPRSRSGTRRLAASRAARRCCGALEREQRARERHRRAIDSIRSGVRAARSRAPNYRAESRTRSARRAAQ